MPRSTDHGAVSLSEFCMPRLTAARLRGGSGAVPFRVRIFVLTRLNVPALVRRNLWRVDGLCPRRQTQGQCPRQVHELCHQNAQ